MSRAPAARPGASPPTVPAPQASLGFRPATTASSPTGPRSSTTSRRLDAASPRVRVEDVGPTTEGRPFLVVTHHVRGEHGAPRGDPPRQPAPGRPARAGRRRGGGARRAAARRSWPLNHGIHSTEVAGTHDRDGDGLLPRRGRRRGDVREILDQTVVLMLPVAQPGRHAEGHRVVPQDAGHALRGRRPRRSCTRSTPGHDNNRDWYMFTQLESRLTVAHLYDRWRPQIVHDVHQMGARAARLFLPPYVDPWEPNVDPALRAAVTALGTHVAARAHQRRASRAWWCTRSTTPGRPPAPTRTRTAACASCPRPRRRAGHADRVPFEDLQRGHRLRPQGRVLELPRPVAGRRLARCATSWTTSSRPRARCSSTPRATATYWLRTFLDVNRRAAARHGARSRSCCPGSSDDPLATAELLARPA